MQQGNRVFVLNMRGKPLMPTTQRKARILLKEKKAKIVNYNPFTIQLNYSTGENKQDVHIGIDTGAKHIGIAVTAEDKILYKADKDFNDPNKLITNNDFMMILHSFEK